MGTLQQQEEEKTAHRPMEPLNSRCLEKVLNRIVTDYFCAEKSENRHKQMYQPRRGIQTDISSGATENWPEIRD